MSDCRNPKERMACAVAEFVQAFANLIPRDEQDAFRMDIAHALQGPNWMDALYREFADWGKTLDAYDTPGLVEHIKAGMAQVDVDACVPFNPDKTKAMLQGTARDYDPKGMLAYRRSADIVREGETTSDAVQRIRKEAEAQP